MAAALLLAACGDPETSPSAKGAAYTNLYEALGRPAGLRLQGDSAVIVTLMVDKQMRGMNRQVAARALARTVARNWPTRHLTSVTVVYRDTKPMLWVYRSIHDDSVRIDDASPTATDTLGAPPARLPNAPPAPLPNAPAARLP